MQSNAFMLLSLYLVLIMIQSIFLVYSTPLSVNLNVSSGLCLNPKLLIKIFIVQRMFSSFFLIHWAAYFCRTFSRFTWNFLKSSWWLIMMKNNSSLIFLEKFFAVLNRHIILIKHFNVKTCYLFLDFHFSLFVWYYKQSRLFSYEWQIALLENKWEKEVTTWKFDILTHNSV